MELELKDRLNKTFKNIQSDFHEVTASVQLYSDK